MTSHLVKRFSLLLALAGAFLFGIAVLPGCGGGGGSDGETAAIDDSDLDELREEVVQLQEEAQQAEAEKYATSNYENGVQSLAQGDEYREEDKLKQAKSRYRRARSSFRDAIESSAKNKESFAEVAELMQQFEAAKAEAEKADVKSYKAKAFEDAVASVADAQKKLQEGTKVSKVKRTINYAIEDLHRAVQDTKVLVQQKTLAEEAKAEAADFLKKAQDANAETVAISDLEYGKQKTDEGDRYFEQGNFRAAAQSYNIAKVSFTDALQAVQDRAALARTSAPTPGQPRGLDGQDGRKSAEEVDVGEIDIPDIGDPDDLDIAANLERLFSVTPEYNNDVITLAYASGREFKNDITILQGEEYLHFEGSDYVGFGQEDYVFASNTIGYILLDCSFEDGAKVSFDILYQILLESGATPYFQVVLMAEDAESCYATNFGSNLMVISNGRARATQPSLNPEHHQDPKKWIQRREPYHTEVKYRKASEEEKGILEVSLDGVTTARVETDKFRKGKIGFRWRNTKFIVTNLEVKGYLDKDWARETLKGKVSEKKDASGGDFDF